MKTCPYLILALLLFSFLGLFPGSVAADSGNPPCSELIVRVNYHFINTSFGNFLPPDAVPPPPNGMNGKQNSWFVENRANQFLEDLKMGTTSLESFIGDSRIRFQTYHDPNNPDDLYDGVWFWDQMPTTSDIHYGDHVLHVFFMDRDTSCANGGHGYPPPGIQVPGMTIFNYHYRVANFPCKVYSADGKSVVYTAPTLNEFWLFSITMIHELGHLLMGSGNHPFEPGYECGGPDGDLLCTAECNTIIGGNPICGSANQCSGMWQNGSNNFMSYVASNESLTPCQVKAMHEGAVGKSYVEFTAATTEAIFHFEDAATNLKTGIYCGEDVYIDGSASQNVEKYYLYGWKRLAGSTDVFMEDFVLGPYIGPVDAHLNLSALLAAAGGQLQDGYEYSIELETINGGCTNRVPTRHRFTYLAEALAPQNPMCNRSPSGDAFLSWDVVNGATSYVLEVSDPDLVSACACINSFGWTVTIDLDDNYYDGALLDWGVCFSWRVRSNCGDWSDWQCFSEQTTCATNCLTTIDFDLPDYVCADVSSPQAQLTNNSTGFSEISFKICRSASEALWQLCLNSVAISPWNTAAGFPTTVDLIQLYNDISNGLYQFECWDPNIKIPQSFYRIEMRLRNECGEEFSLAKKLRVACCTAK
ncbi:MAG: M43 family zinc metalloprotease, partial [Bacteroidota bacterium]